MRKRVKKREGKCNNVTGSKPKNEPKESISTPDTWQISELDEAPEAYQKVNLPELIVETFFLCLALFAVNSAVPNFIFRFDGTQVVSIFDKALFAPIAVTITLTLAVALLLNIYLMIFRKWQTVTRLISVLLDLTGIGIATTIALTPKIWNLTGLSSILGINAQVGSWFSLTVGIVVAVIVIISVFDILTQLKAIIRR